MSDDPSVGLIRSLAQALDEPPAFGMGDSPEGWESFAIVIEFGDGFRSASGYAYAPDGTITAVAASWPSIEGAVHDYLGQYYQPGDRLPVKMLVQLDRSKGRYEITFEETDEERWKVRPKTFRVLREQLRPAFD